MGVQKRQKYPFYAKTSNDNVFQFIDSNNFCINTFWIGAIARGVYNSGLATVKADLDHLYTELKVWHQNR